MTCPEGLVLPNLVASLRLRESRYLPEPVLSCTAVQQVGRVKLRDRRVQNLVLLNEKVLVVVD